MKILFATFWNIPHVGGVWNYMKHLKNKLETNGHEVDFMGYGEDYKYIHLENKRRLVEKKIFFPLINKVMEPLLSTHKEVQMLKFYDLHRYFLELGAAYLGIEQYDLIHTQDVISTACINRIRPKNTPLVATLHGSVAQDLKQAAAKHYPPPTSQLLSRYFNQIEYEGATTPEVTIISNNWLKMNLTQEYHVPAEQLKVSHYGYDIENFLNNIKETSPIEAPKNKKVLIFTGRLAESKGVQHLISALSLLKKIRTDWVCWIVGDGPFETNLKNHCQSVGLKNDVLFLGKRNDIPYLLSVSDIFVLPTLLDNQPFSIIEAQISGKAAIVSDVGGLPEMVEHGVTGLISPAGDEQALCSNLNLLLTDEKQRRVLGSNAQKWGLIHWSLDRAFEDILDVYRTAELKKKNSL